MGKSKMRLAVFAGLFVISLVACGGSSTEQEPTSIHGTLETDNSSQAGRVSMTKKYSGTLYYNYVEPLESPAAMAMDLKKGRYRTVSSGISASVSGDSFAFIDFCSPLSIRLAVADGDGFTNPVSECVDRESIGPDLEAPAMSPNGKFIAVTNYQLWPPRKEDDLGYNLRRKKFTATQIYDLNGDIIAEFKGYGPATWTRKGKLILAGMGADAGFGIYEADKQLKTLKRIDDGRIKDTVWAIDAHPEKDRIAFIFNGQLFDMSLSDGKPKRLHQHGHLLSGLAYSPTGKQIAIVSTDTLEEAMDMGGSGYPIFIFDNGKLHNVRLPHVVSGPLDWTK